MAGTLMTAWKDVLSACRSGLEPPACTTARDSGPANYSDSDINECPPVYSQHPSRRSASICLIWSLIKTWFMNSKCELKPNKEAPRKTGNGSNHPGQLNLFLASGIIKDTGTGRTKCHETPGS
ncbi:hypothetical protein GHT09_018363 [Marmota monax]|uniref:Uncharacterized protein n=1 Tax=Marmota monax TaxID=9995 RepID=A0A834USJ4_MARMO|nr:hypothetical protein GHT09_018363 [Marmota monax]